MASVLRVAIGGVLACVANQRGVEMAIAPTGHNVPETQNIQSYGQLSETNRKILGEGDFRGHKVTYKQVEFHYAKYRFLPVVGWNKKRVVKELQISNTTGRLFAEWDKQQTKTAIKQACAAEVQQPIVRKTKASVSRLSPATRSSGHVSTLGSGGNVSNSGTTSKLSKPGTVSNGSNVRSKLRLPTSELERLADRMLPALKELGVPMVTQEVPVTSTDGSVQTLAIEIKATNGHVFDLTRDEVKAQVRAQLGTTYVSDDEAVDKIMKALYQDAEVTPVVDKNFGTLEVVASYSPRELKYKIEKTQLDADANEEGDFSVARLQESAFAEDGKIEKPISRFQKLYNSIRSNEIELDESLYDELPVEAVPVQEAVELTEEEIDIFEEEEVDLFEFDGLQDAIAWYVRRNFDVDQLPEALEVEMGARLRAQRDNAAQFPTAEDQSEIQGSQIMNKI